MTLSYTKPGFLLEGKVNSAQINPNDKSIVENVNIFTAIEKISNYPKKSFGVGIPGEFEVNDVTIYTYKLSPASEGSFDTIKILIEDISVLYLSSAYDKLKSEDIEMLGDVHLVILDLNIHNLKSILDSIREIEPYYLIIQKDNEGYAEFMKQIGGDVEDLKKLKVESKEFVMNDEASIQTRVVALS